VSALLLDASVWLAALDSDDAHHDAAHAIVASAGGDASPLAALDLTLYEVANVAVLRWRSPETAERLVELIELTCPATLARAGGELVRAAAQVAAAHGITAYDAAYVAAAQRHGWTLVSADLSDLVRPGLAVAPEDVRI
jgi:predicted nucleic acid-binding protein